MNYNPNTAELRIPLTSAGVRLDVALQHLWPEFSRARIQSWIKNGRIQLDGRIVAPRYIVAGDETIVMETQPEPAETGFAPEAIGLNIVHEDEVLIVIDKPAGLVVHPGSGNWSGTLLNALLHHAPRLAEIPRAGIVHRLDKETSGLLVVAKTLPAHTDLVRQLQARTVRRQYVAVVHGVPSADGDVATPIGRHPTQRTKMAVVASGRLARTHYEVLERFERHSVLRCTLETGRTHQIRVHMHSIGHALVGDAVYRISNAHPSTPIFKRQALHAQLLGLVHPATGIQLEWFSPLPEDMSRLITQLRQTNDD